MSEPHLLAADTDRAAVAEALGRAMSTGRLTVAEYDERLTGAYAARTYGELAALTTDLPDDAPVVMQPASAAVLADEPDGHGCAGNGSGWRSWASTSVLVLAIWIVSMIGAHDVSYPWPVWVIGPWGAVLLSRSRRGHHRPREVS